jgi:hypothetical protein
VAETAFVHFSVDGDRLAVPLEEIREVARVSQIAPVPRAPAVIRGLANIRGRVVTLLDMDVIYGRRTSPPSTAGVPDPAGAAGHAVVLASPRDHLALWTRSRVDIGRGGTAPVEGPASAPTGGSDGANLGGANHGGASRDSIGALSGGLVVCDGQIAHLVSAATVADHCEERILARYRRRD